MAWRWARQPAAAVTRSAGGGCAAAAASNSFFTSRALLTSGDTTMPRPSTASHCAATLLPWWHKFRVLWSALGAWPQALCE